MAVAVFIATFAFMGYVNWHFRFDLGDDAFIHLRIARNLVQTGHPYFNPGERVMVTSSPVWTALLALIDLLFGTKNALWWLNAAFVAVATTVSYLIVWTWIESRRWQEMIVALILPLAVLAELANSAFLGMETPLAITLLLIASLAFVRSRAYALPLLAAAAFTRYELGALLAVVGFVCLVTRTTKKYGALPGAVFVGALMAWLFSQFGTILPNSIKAKSIGYGLTASQALADLWPRPVILVAYGKVLPWIGLALLVSWLVEPMCDERRREGLRIVALSLVLWGITLGTLYVWRKVFVFDWYKPLVWTPIMVGGLLMILIDHSMPRRMLALLLVAIFFLGSFVSLWGWLDVARTKRLEGIPVFSESARVHEYLAAGAALHQACPQAQLMTSEIGGLGYGFQGNVLDGFGLASPDAIKYHPMRVPQERTSHYFGAIPPGFVREKQPDLIATYDSLGEAVLASRDILEKYDDLRFFPVLPREASAGVRPPWGLLTFHVLVKKGGGCPVSNVIESISTVLQARQ